MRIAMAGKGGAGKTTVTATLARLAARQGASVLCIDADSNPNLAIALSGGSITAPDALPPSIISRRFDGPALTDPVDEILTRHAVEGPDGVRLALMGMPKHAEEGCMCAAHATVSGMLADLGPTDVFTLVDMEASPEHFSRGTAKHVDTLLFVAEPYYRSLETVRRMAQLAAELPIERVAVVANKLRDDTDREALADFCDRHDLELIAAVPWGDAVLDADRDRTPLLDVDPDGDVVVAVGKLLASLQA